MKKKLVLMMLALVGSVGVCKGQVPDGFYQYHFRCVEFDSTTSRFISDFFYESAWRVAIDDTTLMLYTYNEYNKPHEMYRVVIDGSPQFDVALFGTQGYKESMVYYRIWLIDDETVHYLDSDDEREDVDSTSFDAINICNVRNSGFMVKWRNPMARKWFSMQWKERSYIIGDTLPPLPYEFEVPDTVWMHEYWDKKRPSYEALIVSYIFDGKEKYHVEGGGQGLKGWWKYKELAYIDLNGKAVVQPQEEGKYLKYFDDDFQINYIKTGRKYPEWQYEGYIKPIEYVSKEGNVELVKEANNLSLFRLSGNQCKLTYYSDNGFIVHELWERL